MRHVGIEFKITPPFPDLAGAETTLHINGDDWVLSGQYGPLFHQEKIEKTVSSSHIEKILAKLADVKIPSIPQFSTGCDGTTYYLKLTHGFNSTSYKWWGAIPEEYQPLKYLCKTLLQLAKIETEVP